MTNLETEFRSYLPRVSAEETRSLLETFGSMDVGDLQEPETGLVMLTALDCYTHPFHLGELLVTQAEVTVDGVRAHATVMGDQAEKAILAATLNGALRHTEAERLTREFVAGWTTLLPGIQERRDEEMGVAATTKVAFENMAEEEEI